MNFYQEVERIPLIVRTPAAKASRAVEGRVSLIDVLPTLAELAGAEVNFPIDGMSFASALTDNADAPRGKGGAIFSEYHGYRSPTSAYMTIKGRHKYCQYLAEPCELYDLENDPRERSNLLEKRSHQRLQRRMQAEIGKILDVAAFEETIREYNVRRQAVVEGLSRSCAIEREAKDRIRRFRRDLNEPWWDGGEYMAREKVKQAAMLKERLAKGPDGSGAALRGEAPVKKGKRP